MKKLFFPVLVLLISLGLIIGCSSGGGGSSTGSDTSNLTVSTMEIKGKFNVSNSSAAAANHQPALLSPSRLAMPKNPVALLNDLKNNKVVAQSAIDAYGNFAFYGDFRELTLSISIASTDTEIIIGSVPSNMPLNSRLLVSYPYDNTGGFDEYAVITSNIIKCKNLVDSIKIDRYNGAQNLWDFVSTLKPEIQAYITANPSKKLSTLVTETVSAGSSATMAITSKINLPAGDFDHFYMTTDSPQVAGSPITLTIYAKDANESTVTNYAGTGTMILSNPAGTITWSGNGLSNAGNGAASYSSLTFSKGVASIRVTSSSTDISKAFTITDSSTGKYTSTTLTWNVNTSQIFDHFTVTSNSPQSMNSFITLTVTAKNSADGLVNTYAGTGTLAISSPSGTITWSGTGVTAGTNGSATFSSATFTSGVASIQVKSSVVESSKTFTITDTASEKSSTATVSWINDILDHFSISTISSPQSAGVPFLITITAQNSSNETIPNFSGTASLSDTTNTITPNVTGAFANGVWSGNVTIPSVGSNITILASSNSKVGASNPITLNKALLSISLSKTSDVALVSSSYDLSKVKVTAQYSGSTSSNVAASWSIQAGGGSISGINYNAPSSAVVALLTASYTEGSITKTATLVLDVLSSLKVASPVFTPASGTTFTTSQSVTISCATAGASIKYTIDGSTPSASNGIAYSGTITVSSTTTIKAIAYKSGLTDSDVVTATYTKTGSTPGETKIVDIGGGVSIEFVWIPAGTFQMGSPESEPSRYSNETQHNVTISKGFYMSKYETTQGQWKAIMSGANPSSAKTGDNYPVETVSWNDITNSFLPAINSKNLGQGTFRLPTEAEWEYACRAGTTTAYYWGASINGNYCWYDGNSSTTHPVGQKLPNAWGLYDTSGNVAELCSDLYGTYPSSAITDPTGTTSGSSRISRGGSGSSASFKNGAPVSGAVLCRSADRYTNDPAIGSAFGGFRLVLSTDSQATGKVGSPTISPNGGTFITSQNVTISCTTTGATIKYTTDGSTPSATNGTLYNGTITVSTSLTLKAIAYKSGMTDSDISSIAFTVSPAQLSVDLGNGVILEMRKIPAGTFQMGQAGVVFAEPVHTVTITKDFYMAKYELTQAQWLKIYGSWPGTSPTAETGSGDNYPAYNVSWNDITDVSTGFLKKINDKNLQSDGTFRLPTEAEWEYACRAGTTTAYYWGSVFNGDYCWEYTNSGGMSKSVGSTAGVAKGITVANAFGLYDMSGNVAEWCSDWYGAYSASSITDPSGPASGSNKVFRGNSFLNSGDYSKSASRESISPSSRSSSVGFRIVLSQ